MENKELKDRFIDEKTGIEYIRNGDYYLPNLVIEPQRKIDLNKYGRLRLEYLKKYKKAEYTILFIDNKLIDHLEGVQEAATKRVEEIIKSLKEQRYKSGNYFPQESCFIGKQFAPLRHYFPTEVSSMGSHCK